MKSGYEIFSTTADGGFNIWAPDLAELFSQAGQALFAMMTDLNSVTVQKYFDISIDAPALEDLLVNWVNELIYISEVHHVFIKEFRIVKINQFKLLARVGGEPIDQQKHCFDSEVKAATYHNLSITQNDIYKATIVVDL
ncbi:archease [candidate division CSSED10-310 bacterium]|uniref:Archease n=1 Tax=candidate division CSSED10-310 bacterium TaxID=2855610 RepID=A0ABV6Z4L9_UNCC1